LLLAEQLYALGRKNEAIKVLDRAMQIMPEETVMDYGDINPVDPFNSLNYNKAHNQFMYQGQDIRPLNAGILHEFVQLYYLLGQDQKAAALGQKLLENYQSVVAFFEHSDVEIAGNEENAEDLIAVADALLKMRTTIKENNTNGTAFERSLEKTIQVLYKKVLPRIYSGLDALASENGEAGDGLYTNRLANLQLYMGALAEHHGLVKAPVVNRAPAPVQPSNIDVNALTTPGQGPDTNRMMQ
jgi:tetratricopeptide (TPR) repeat protein